MRAAPLPERRLVDRDPCSVGGADPQRRAAGRHEKRKRDSGGGTVEVDPVEWPLVAWAITRGETQTGLTTFQMTPTPQRHEDATLDWSRPARDLVYVVRGCNPWPGATARSPRGPLLTFWRALGVDKTVAPQVAGPA
jgi:hypothetical protein